ncbi:TonB-dependent receptor [Novosphingobium sp. BL-8H]|uniref:TonB-dependent receptor plug domain-containing protein n=1 Tax=Novosphingobium sp. BL-8H TaxID=3127640 RepID=UPI003756971F
MRKAHRAAALLCGASLLHAMPALAQDAAAASAQEEPADAEPAVPAQDIIVTGSRAIRNGDSMPSPVTVVQPSNLLAVQPGTLADALNTLPVFAGARGRTSNPTSTGSGGAGNGSANQLNLRNLGPTRTLVLMDGLRVPPTLLNGVVDVDIIPQMLVQRVDTVTGGVSAVYGSDAVSGVVNYIIDKGFNGLKMQASSGISQRGDASQYDVGVAGGTSLFGGRGHIEASYEYRKEGGIKYRSSRDYLDNIGVTGTGTAANPYVLQHDVRQANTPFGGLITSGPLAGQIFGENGVLRPFVHGTATGTSGLEIGGDGGYYDSSLVSPLEFNQIFGRFDFDVSDKVHFHAQVAGDIKSNQNWADPLRLSGATISSTNAFLPQAYQTAMAGVGSFKFGEMVNESGRLNSVSHTDQWTANAGFDGKLGGFDWKLDYVWGVTTLKTTLNNNVNNQNLSAALDAVTDPATGNVVCRVTLTNPGQMPGCVPLNVFGPTAASQAALAYVMPSTHYRAQTRMNDISGSIAGSPLSTWAGPINAALSAEWRKVSFEADSDTDPNQYADCTGLRYNCTSTTKLWLNSFAASPKVSQTVYEAALEVDVPLLKDVPLIQALNLNGAARYTHYNTSGTYWTWKAGLDWHVTDTLRIRGTRSRDIRAPTLYELFAPANSVPVNPVDLLTNTSPSVQQTDLSNPDLKAEIANTLTGGVVWTPTPRASIAVDAYHITIDDAVTQIAGSTTAYQQACYASGGTSFYCSLQDRPNGYADTSAANAVTHWYTLYMNLAQVETWGIDVEGNYRASLFGRPASLRVLTSWQPHVYYRQQGTSTLDQGNVAFGPLGLSAGPAWRISAFAQFKPAEHLTVDLLERWRGAMKLGGDSTQYWVSNHVASFATTNLTLTFDADAGFGKAEFFVNVTNLFDAKPPAAAYSGNGTRAGLRDGFALSDDPIGRAFLAGLRIKL